MQIENKNSKTFLMKVITFGSQYFKKVTLQIVNFVLKLKSLYIYLFIFFNNFIFSS